MVMRAGWIDAFTTATRQYPGFGGPTPVTGVVVMQRPCSPDSLRTAQPYRIPTPSISCCLSRLLTTLTSTEVGTSFPAEPDLLGQPHARHRHAAIPPTVVTPQTPKKRVLLRFPIAASVKKFRSRAPPVSQARPNRNDCKRRSVGEHPVPADEDMVRCDSCLVSNGACLVVSVGALD